MFPLAQAVEVAVVPHASPWTPELIVALFAGLTGIIGAMTTLFVSMAKAKKEIRDGMADNKRVVREVHDFVNGSNTKLLQEVARLTTLVAEMSGKKADTTASEIAHEAVAQKLHTDEKALQNRAVIAEAEAKGVAAKDVPKVEGT